MKKTITLADKFHSDI